jgi:hypothetical protein
MLNKDTSRRNGINVRDEKEFKIWVKLICSIHRDGEDISKPLNILWKSVQEEIDILERKSKYLDKILES